MPDYHSPEKDPQTLETILEAQNSLQGIRLKTAQIQQAQHILTQFLSAKLLLHCSVGHIDQQKITLFADSAVWATQLRYRQGEILTYFRQQSGFRGLHRVKIKIVTPQAKAKPAATATRQQTTLSSKVVSLVQQSATTINNPVLKKALLKLANNHKS